MWITWKHQHTELTDDAPIEKKIEIFRERVLGWQLHVADLVINGGRDHDNVRDIASIPHSGFATLQILLSYFEMIACYEAGIAGKTKGQSRDLFIQGVQFAFPQVKSFPYAATRNFLSHLYSSVRCGLYHTSIPGSGVGLAPTGIPIQFTDDPPQLVIDPHEFARALRTQFLDYVARLNDPSQVILRTAFEKRFDYEFKQWMV